MIEINLVAERMRQRRRAELLQRIAAVACLAFFVAAVLSVLWVFKGTWDLQHQIAGTQLELQQVKEQKREIDELKEQINTDEPLVRLLRRARSSETEMCQLLLDVARAIPEQVAVEELRTSDTLRPRVTNTGQPPPPAQRGVTIVGVADNNALIGQFMEQLGRMESFGETFLSYAQQTEDENRNGEKIVIYRFEVIALCGKEA
jgi:Tfp pilus assembly protein PilN